MELLVIILASLLVTIFLILIFNSNYKTKSKSNTIYSSASKNSYTKAGDVFNTLKKSNVKINFLGDSDEQ